MFISSYI